jgi:hypothetical protein
MSATGEGLAGGTHRAHGVCHRITMKEIGFSLHRSLPQLLIILGDAIRNPGYCARRVL